MPTSTQSAPPPPVLTCVCPPVATLSKHISTSGLHSISATTLQTHCFANEKTPPHYDQLPPALTDASVSSNSTSMASSLASTTSQATSSPSLAPQPATSPTKFLALPTNSRQGRDHQRWENGMRLVTGTVPILRDGKILLCSSSKKKEWILPKGGWEVDETLEEAACRETYEECGVVGMLGPVLTAFVHTTRKNKVRKGSASEELRASFEADERANRAFRGVLPARREGQPWRARQLQANVCRSRDSYMPGWTFEHIFRACSMRFRNAVLVVNSLKCVWHTAAPFACGSQVYVARAGRGNVSWLRARVVLLPPPRPRLPRSHRLSPAEQNHVLPPLRSGRA